MDVERRVSDLEKQCIGVLSSNKDRDHLIILTFALVVAYMAYIWYTQKMGKSTFDGRPHAIPLQMLDHTGSHNFAPFKHYGVE